VVLATGLALGGCSHRGSIASCDDDLRGVYVADGGRWMVLDRGATLEAYPLFPDVPTTAPAIDLRLPGGVPAGAPPALEVAPRMLALERVALAGAAAVRLEGTVQRRYMLRDQACVAHLPAHVTRCAGDTLDVVLADPAPPLGFSPCSWPGAAPSRLVHWQRE